MWSRKVIGAAYEQTCNAVCQRSVHQTRESLHRSIAHSRRQFSITVTRRQAKDDSKKSNGEARDSLSEFLDSSLDLKKDATTPSTRPSRFASPRAQQQRRPDQQAAPPPPGASNSIANLLTQFGKRQSTRMNTDDMEQPPSAISRQLDPQGNTRFSRQEPLIYPLPVRLGPNLGRTVKVNPQRNVDIGRAFRQLDSLVKRNHVKLDFNKQKFHERPGLRRKRVRRERWRRTFKEGFKGMVALVKRMKKQGW